jgi:hypothetical protein
MAPPTPLVGEVLAEHAKKNASPGRNITTGVLHGEVAALDHPRQLHGTPQLQLAPRATHVRAPQRTRSRSISPSLASYVASPSRIGGCALDWLHSPWLHLGLAPCAVAAPWPISERCEGSVSWGNADSRGFHGRSPQIRRPGGPRRTEAVPCTPKVSSLLKRPQDASRGDGEFVAHGEIRDDRRRSASICVPNDWKPSE